jgi:atypical dual specificity phosphatase
MHLPVDDFHAPTTAQMLDALAFLDRARAAGTPAAVHCLAGQGRTGTVLAAYLIRGGLDADQAVAEVRAVCPGAVEATPQTVALAEWAAERPWFI